MSYGKVNKHTKLGYEHVLLVVSNKVLTMSKKRKVKDTNDEYEYDPVPKHMVTAHLKNQEKRLIIILEGAQLETVKVCCLDYHILKPALSVIQIF